MLGRCVASGSETLWAAAVSLIGWRFLWMLFSSQRLAESLQNQNPTRHRICVWAGGLSQRTEDSNAAFTRISSPAVVSPVIHTAAPAGRWAGIPAPDTTEKRGYRIAQSYVKRKDPGGRRLGWR
ncbi:hypothetical protein VTJ49DRAFT_4172 [Mycothermus thermophilus]|uniref:Uncharacterized protein n=1 Tax=Humicola insolens TaxID=85995 RepID=A0ABR3V6Y4_HUMIN